MITKAINSFFGFFFLLISFQVSVAQETELSKAGIRLIPYPREVKLRGADFVLENSVTITLDKNASEKDKFAAAELAKYLSDELKIKSAIQHVVAPGKSIVLTRKGVDKKYHVQIVPLVQGLGHASFILKWPKYAHLREIPASNFEFCPLKEESYKLLFDLWDDAGLHYQVWMLSFVTTAAYSWNAALPLNGVGNSQHIVSISRPENNNDLYTSAISSPIVSGVDTLVKVKLPDRYFRLLEEGILRVEQRLDAEPEAELPVLEAKPGWKRLAVRVLHRFSTQEQSVDGYWGEFDNDGPTTGYDYLTMTQIALYWEYSKDPAALKALRSSTDFHKYYTCLDGTLVETINDRNRYWGVSMWGHFGFSHFPDGRRYAAFLTGFVPPNGGDWLSFGRIAQNALYYHEGNEALIPQDQTQYVHAMKVPAGIRKTGPWVVCLSENKKK